MSGKEILYLRKDLHFQAFRNDENLIVIQQHWIGQEKNTVYLTDDELEDIYKNNLKAHKS